MSRLFPGKKKIVLNPSEEGLIIQSIKTQTVITTADIDFSRHLLKAKNFMENKETLWKIRKKMENKI